MSKNTIGQSMVVKRDKKFPATNLKDSDFAVSGWCGNRPRCVQVAVKRGFVAVRDSKDPSKATQVYTPGEWRAFIKGGEKWPVRRLAIRQIFKRGGSNATPISMKDKNTIYIIPELGSDCSERQYKELTTELEKTGNFVIQIKPDWYKPISIQKFDIKDDAVLIGFSMGAVVAYLIAKKQTCRKVIFASMSPIHTFTHEDNVNDLLPYMKKEDAELIAKDLENIQIDLTQIRVPYVTMSGEYEHMKSDIVVPNTGHQLTGEYIKTILTLV